MNVFAGPGLGAGSSPFEIKLVAALFKPNYWRFTMTTQSIKFDPQTLYRRFVEDAVEHVLAKVSLDEDGLRRLVSNSAEFQRDIVASIKRYSISHLFASEEMESSSGY